MKYIDGIWVDYIMYLYSEDGTQTISHFFNGDTNRRQTLKYNENDLLVYSKEESLNFYYTENENPSLRLYSIRWYEYNDESDLILEKTYLPNRYYKYYMSKYSYEKDEYGNIVVKHLYDSLDNLISTDKIKYTYYPDGLVKEKYNPDHIEWTYQKFTYNDEGQILSIMNNDSIKTETFVYENGLISEKHILGIANYMNIYDVKTIIYYEY